MFCNNQYYHILFCHLLRQSVKNVSFIASIVQRWELVKGSGNSVFHKKHVHYFDKMKLFFYIITYGAKVLNADWLRQRAFFLNHKGNLGNQEGMTT